MSQNFTEAVTNALQQAFADAQKRPFHHDIKSWFRTPSGRSKKVSFKVA